MTNRFSLDGQVAVVTGASRGIGLEIARAIAESGARVWLTAADSEQLHESAARLRSEGHDVALRTLDLADGAACVAAIHEIGTAEGGRVDILVNNAENKGGNEGVHAPAAVWEHVMGTNLRAPYLLCREAARLMARRRYGRIVNIGSALTVDGCRNGPIHASTKHGLAGMTRALAAELGPMGITVNMMAPGYFLTEMNTTTFDLPHDETGVSSRIPLGRLGAAHEAGGVVAFMVSKASGYMSGHVLVVDGGLTETFLLPVDAA